MLLTFLILLGAGTLFVVLTARRIGALFALGLMVSCMFTTSMYLKASQSLGTANPALVGFRVFEIAVDQLRCRIRASRHESRCPDVGGSLKET